MSNLIIKFMDKYKYCVVKAQDTNELECMVNQKLTEGWSLCGPLWIDGGQYCQTLAKGDDVKEKMLLVSDFRFL